MKIKKSIHYAGLILALALLFGACGGGGSDSPPVPAANTGGASDIGLDNATVTGTVNPNGVDTTAWFEWGTSSSSLSNVTTHQSIGAGSGNVTVSADLTGLADNTTYYYRVVGSNANGTTRGDVEHFTTTSRNDPPTVQNFAADNKTTSGARLNASVNPNGLATTAHFEYSTNSSLTSPSVTDDQSVGSGLVSQTVRATIAGLNPGATYYYRIVATNSAGTSRGTPIASFQTSPLILPPTANAGADQTVYMLGPYGLRTITLDGTGSTSDNGTITTWQWTQLSGEEVELDGADTDTATFDAPVVAYPGDAYLDLLFNLTVTDNNSNTGSDNVAVRVKWAYKDDFAVDSTETYTVDTPLGDAGTFTYNSGAARANAPAANSVSFSHDFGPGFSATQGVFSFNYNPGATYGSGLALDVMIGESYSTCYRINAEDGEIQKWRAGVKVDSAAFDPTLVEGNGYWFKLSFQAESFTVTITNGGTTQTFGPLTLNDEFVSVERFTIAAIEQRSDFDNIVLDVVY